jgi:hypothetical protein
MASGYFPLNGRDPNGARLLEAAKLVDDVIREMRDDCRELECTEDGVSDGITLGRLGVAVDLINRAVR